MNSRMEKQKTRRPKLRDKAGSVVEFLDWASKVRSQFRFPGEDPMGPWFRGHEREGWLLCPKLLREELYGDDQRLEERNVEDEIVEEFTIRAAALSETIPDQDDVWAWWFLAQHFGVPTRLLDWTEGALLALFFAVKDNSGDDRAVWALDPYELNAKVLGFGQDWVPCPCVPGTSEDEMGKMKPWLPRRFVGRRLEPQQPLPESAFAVLPSHIALRIGTQRSCFTVHGTDRGYLDRLAVEGNDGMYLARITIPRDCVVPIRRELDSCGIDEATAFPDLDHLGRVLSLKWQTSTPGR
jgi:hypothetical protein